MLDESARWDRELGDDEQQALAFSRVLIHNPRWLLIDEVLESVDEDTSRRIAAVLTGDLPRTGIINIGRPQLDPKLFPRVLHLVKDPHTRTLPRSHAAEILATPARPPQTSLVGA
jgi:putative ATP-binding cassette transporter